MKKYKRVKCVFNRNRQQNTSKNKKSTGKEIIKEKSEERMNRGINKKWRNWDSRCEHLQIKVNVKYCGMEETTKLLNNVAYARMIRSQKRIGGITEVKH